MLGEADAAGETCPLPLGVDRIQVGLREDVASEIPLKNGKNVNRPHKEAY